MFRTVKFRFRKLFVSDRNRISHPSSKEEPYHECQNNNNNNNNNNKHNNKHKNNIYNSDQINGAQSDRAKHVAQLNWNNPSIA